MVEPNQEQKAGFNIQKIYIKDVSYETTNVPHVFMQESMPQAKIQFAIGHTVLDQNDGLYEVELTVTVSATLTDQTIFLVEVKQAGVFRIQGLEDKELSRVIGIGCPNVLLPFAREVVNDLVTKGGFPQLMLAPVNFDALYQQKSGTQKEEA